MSSVATIRDIKAELGAISANRSISALEKTNKLVAWAQKHFAWGLNPLKALIGISEEDIARNTAATLAHSNHAHANMGGTVPEVVEAVAAKHAFDKCPQQNKTEKNKLRKKLESEFADVLMMVLVWGNKLGVNIENALKATVNKMQKRFGRVLQVADNQSTNLKDPAAFQQLWKQAKKQEQLT